MFMGFRIPLKILHVFIFYIRYSPHINRLASVGNKLWLIEFRTLRRCDVICDFWIVVIIFSWEKQKKRKIRFSYLYKNAIDNFPIKSLLLKFFLNNLQARLQPVEPAKNSFPLCKKCPCLEFSWFVFSYIQTDYGEMW